MTHGDLTITNRGFERVTFCDQCDNGCELQQSSAVGDYDDSLSRPGTSFVWLGVDDAKPVIMASDAIKLGLPVPAGVNTGWIPYEIPREVLLHTRMHLDRERVKWLVKSLNHWLQTGSLNFPE